MTRVLALLLLALPAFAGTAPEADLTAPIPVCDAAFLFPDDDTFTGLHPDAWSQYAQFMEALCGPLTDRLTNIQDASAFDDARSWAILRGWFAGPDVPVPVAPVPLPDGIWLLAAAVAALVWKGSKHA